MNKEDRKIKTFYRIFAGVCSVLFILGLGLELFVAETKSWGFLISGSLLTILFVYVSVQGKVAKWFQSINN